eukprot:Skav225298  [mRNA]  locus=scaffold445:34499:42219:- [translate_table: standard]
MVPREPRWLHEVSAPVPWVDQGEARSLVQDGGEKAALIAAQKDPLNLSGTPRLAFQRCGAPEKTKREGLAARLPTGAIALGVGASLDGGADEPVVSREALVGG